MSISFARTWLLLACILTFMGCNTKHIVKKADPNSADQKSGLYYALPLTVIEVTATVETTISTPSEYVSSLDANDLKTLETDITTHLQGYVSVKQLVSTETTTHKLKDVSLKPLAHADADHVYYVELRGGPFEEREFNLTLLPDLTISAASSTSTDKTLEFVAQVTEKAATVAGKLITPSALADKSSLPEQILVALKDVRQRRLNLVSGYTFGTVGGQPKETLELMLAELAKEEDAIKRVLTGTRTTITKTHVFQFTPTRDNNDTCLFEIVTKGKDGGVQPCTQKGLQADVERVKLSVNFSPARDKQVISKIGSPSGERSYYYRIPARTEAIVTVNDSVKTKQEILVAQMGVVASLPVGLGTPGSSFSPTFHAETGGLKNIKVTASPPSLEATGKIAGAVDPIVDGLIAREKAEADADAAKKAKRDQLAQLERERKILEEQKKIRDLEKELGTTTP